MKMKLEYMGPKEILDYVKNRAMIAIMEILDGYNESGNADDVCSRCLGIKHVVDMVEEDYCNYEMAREAEANDRS